MGNDFTKNRINIFCFAAYNNGVEEITIVQNGFDALYMSYLYGKVKERFAFLPSSCDLQRQGDCSMLAFKTEKEYCPYVRRFAEENMADVVAVGYKYHFFENKIRVPLLSKTQKRILITALVAADYKDDKAYVLQKIKGLQRYCLDGVYHFCLQGLKERWQGVAEYVPTDMGASALEEFLRFLAEDGDGKAFVKGARVYDEEYRPLSKSTLTGKQSVIGEILLCGAERIYCFGETERETAAFLKKYYREKAVFC